MSHTLLLPVGSHGDVHPFAAIGRELRGRGHRVTMITAEVFRGIAESNGFDFVPTLTPDEYQALMHHPDLWHPTKSMPVIFDSTLIAKYLPIVHQAIAERFVPGETILVGGTMAYAARTAHDHFGIPFVTLHLQPMSCCSIADPPVHSSGRNFTWLPRPLIRVAYWAAERFITDPLLIPAINSFRKSLNLPPVSRVLTQWASSPQCVLGIFPSWFGLVPDMGETFHHVGFIPFDDANARPTPPELTRFLDAGNPPVIFSFGSAMRNGRPYFEAAVEACRLLGCRAVILAKGGAQIPESLPVNVVQADYAPFSDVFPKASLVVHHGGIGTSAQAIRAGVPQMIMPLAFDQADNAHRLRKLGLSRTRFPKSFTGRTIANDIATIQSDSAMRTRAAFQRTLLTDGVTDAANHIERMLISHRPRS